MLTCTLQLDSADTAQAQALLPILERKAGRVLANGFPTGVEVSDTMVHGGPYPASTNFGATSVGTLSIRRFLRPVCYQISRRSFCRRISPPVNSAPHTAARLPVSNLAAAPDLCTALFPLFGTFVYQPLLF
ncbi:hypothetical protein [Marinobacterium rhizophilum]|uniref:hypothetical protein n=1 Tax=Marinobacterium rhizophilum TaxID=420402 RepID=UPI0003A53E61|nr:hypothetical protein [Marinobacterium rhizophilum]